MLSYIIPDVPEALKEQIKRERYLTQKILHETNIKKFTEFIKPVAEKLQDQVEEPELDLKLWSLTDTVLNPCTTPRIQTHVS